MRLLAPIVTATLVLACKQGASPEAVIKKHRAAVEQTLDDAAKVLKKARKEPEASADDVLPDDAPATGGSDEVATEQIEELERLVDESAKAPPMDLADSGRLGTCAKALRVDDTSHAAASDVERCAKAKYLLVLRIREYRAPSKSGTKSFTPGEVEGDALLYRLKGAKRIGAFAFTATNSDKVGVSKSVEEHDLRKDLERAVTRALAAGGKKTEKAKKADDD